MADHETDSIRDKFKIAYAEYVDTLTYKELCNRFTIGQLRESAKHYDETGENDSGFFDIRQQL